MKKTACFLYKKCNIEAPSLAELNGRIKNGTEKPQMKKAMNHDCTDDFLPGYSSCQVAQIGLKILYSRNFTSDSKFKEK